MEEGLQAANEIESFLRSKVLLEKLPFVTLLGNLEGKCMTFHSPAVKLNPLSMSGFASSSDP